MKFGVFDSGIGGVTVLQALRNEFPEVRFAYFGDTLHVPYGTKSASQIRLLSASAAERIRSHALDALIVACNTASSLALPEIEGVLGSTPVYGMVEAGVRAVLRATEDSKVSAHAGPVVVFGTRATIRSGVYGNHFRTSFGDESISGSREVFEQACPLLVPLIEEGWIRHPVLDATLHEYVAPYRDQEPGIALLACTHYPWIREAFERALPGWKVIDSADAVASRLREESQRFGLTARPGETIVPDPTPSAPVEWYFSDPEIAPFIFEGTEPAPVIRTF